MSDMQLPVLCEVNPCRGSRRRFSPAFTIVELLVVISLILILLAIGIPAVNEARETARLAQCVNNLKELGTATLSYESRKNHFPGWMNPNGSNPALSWLSQILGELGRGPLYDQVVGGPPPNVRLDVMLCPSDAQPTPNTADATYVCNVGSNAAQGQNRDEGVFLDRHAMPSRKIQLSYITRLDGAATTVLASENIAATTWHAFGFIDWGTPPESKHDDGANVLFADGHVRFLTNETMAPANTNSDGTIVWQMLCAPNDSAAMLSGELTEELLNK